jgi:hypothetical protein
MARRIQGLRELVARGQRGSLVDFSQVLVVVDRTLVQSLLRAATPLSGTVAERYAVRLDSATTEFSDGFALVTLEGGAELVGQQVAADLRLFASLDVVDLERDSGLLRCRVNVFAVEAARANVLGVDEPFRDLVEALTHDGLSAILSAIEVPVRVADRITIPEVDTPRLRIAAADVPFEAGVLDVRVFADRLWVAIGAKVGPEAAEGRATVEVPRPRVIPGPGASRASLLWQ